MFFKERLSYELVVYTNSPISLLCVRFLVIPLVNLDVVLNFDIFLQILICRNSEQIMSDNSSHPHSKFCPNSGQLNSTDLLKEWIWIYSYFSIITIIFLLYILDIGIISNIYLNSLTLRLKFNFILITSLKIPYSFKWFMIHLNDL